MAKKNSHKDTSGVVFDTHSKMVMSQGGTYERMKEKISAVRAVVPNKSNNEIVLVLQHFENCVDRAVQAFVEGSATEILKEWNVTGKKKPKKKKKPKPQPEVPAEPEQTEPDPAKATPPSDGKDEVNGFHANGSVLDGDSLDSLSEQLDSASLDAAELDSEPATPELSDATSGVEVDSKPRPQSQASHFSQGGRSTLAVFQHNCDFLYLLDEQTSLLVLIPAGIGSVIEVWKVKKAFKIQVVWNGLKPTFQFGKSDESERRTEEYDTLAMKYLSYLLYPMCFGGAVYSLVYVKYKSWYSWLINSMVNGVYAFGFLFMLPQLFVNYKLKSVAHLPWKAFMYKAFNTFIDDVFAFIITMPTSHRLACFRDDVVFLVYLYQRWLYPVDKSRVNEYGVSYDKKPKEKTHKD